jgi:hypothetical protein
VQARMVMNYAAGHEVETDCQTPTYHKRGHSRDIQMFTTYDCGRTW